MSISVHNFEGIQNALQSTFDDDAKNEERTTGYDIGEITKVEQISGSLYLLHTEDGWQISIDDLSIEMLFAIYTTGTDMTVDDWKVWAENQ